MEQDDCRRKTVRTDRAEEAGGSEYLDCNGVERFVVTYVDRFRRIRRNHHPQSTRVGYLDELFVDVNLSRCEATLDEIKNTIEPCISKGWIEWALVDDDEYVLCRTALGNEACRCGADDNRTFPAPTINGSEAAERIILQILNNAALDPEQTLRGDPRIKEGAVFGSDLFVWARNFGVGRNAFLAAEAECLGEGYVASTPCYAGASYRITARGKRLLGAEDATASAPWLIVTEAAGILMQSFPTLDLSKARSRVSWACGKKKFRSNGETGRGRRIERTGFLAWVYEQVQIDLKKERAM